MRFDLGLMARTRRKSGPNSSLRSCLWLGCWARRRSGPSPRLESGVDIRRQSDNLARRTWYLPRRGFAGNMRPCLWPGLWSYLWSGLRSCLRSGLGFGLWHGLRHAILPNRAPRRWLSGVCSGLPGWRSAAARQAASHWNALSRGLPLTASHGFHPSAKHERVAEADPIAVVIGTAESSSPLGGLLVQAVSANQNVALVAVQLLDNGWHRRSPPRVDLLDSGWHRRSPPRVDTHSGDFPTRRRCLDPCQPTERLATRSNFALQVPQTLGDGFLAPARHDLAPELAKALCN
mmetsp:Transcript_122411/g.346046  ORF Transcript_122411/g.346046 Transcript_122411/m.346046 type:complete len:290 (-) Transcript_122411:215-1084(-)